MLDGVAVLARRVNRYYNNLVEWMLGRWRANPVEKNVVIDYFLHGLSPHVIAEKYGVPHSWVTRVLRLYKNKGVNQVRKLVYRLTVGT